MTTVYDPPHGYTAEDLMQFKGADEAFPSIEDAQEVIDERDKYGTLEAELKEWAKTRKDLSITFMMYIYDEPGNDM
ncbi:hypothetical protein H0H92_004301 [Tricholoma furcatifolium]|nr:hypothetical protein H0H92_004301 [Tricholoma furcatifolium]